MHRWGRCRRWQAHKHYAPSIKSTVTPCNLIWTSHTRACPSVVSPSASSASRSEDSLLASPKTSLSLFYGADHSNHQRRRAYPKPGPPGPAPGCSRCLTPGHHSLSPGSFTLRLHECRQMNPADAQGECSAHQKRLGSRLVPPSHTSSPSLLCMPKSDKFFPPPAL